MHVFKIVIILSQTQHWPAGTCLFRGVLSSACFGHSLGDRLYYFLPLLTFFYSLQTHDKRTDRAHRSQSRRPGGCTAPFSYMAGT